MMTVPITTSRASIGKIFQELVAQMAKVGLNLSIWDATGRPALELELSCELCRTLCEAGNGCRAALCHLASKVMSQDQREIAVLPAGCCVMAMPIRRRRRIIGAATACYPTREMADGEALARLCSRLKLDGQVVSGLARRCCRREVADSQALIEVGEWVLQTELAQATARDELANLSANLAATYEELSLLYRISGSMRVTQEPADFMHTVCEDLLEVMNVSAAAAVEYARPSVGGPDTVVIAGEIDLTVEQLRHLLTGLIAGRFREEQGAVVDNNFAPQEPEIARAVRNFVAVPLVAEEGCIGVLVGLNKLAGDFDSIDIKLLGSIGSQASVFLANSRLYAERQGLLMGVLHALTASIDAKDPYTCGHSHRVAMISRRIAEQMEFPPEKIERIYLCGLLHDIGKIGVPEAVLTKPGRLTEDEYEKIRRHPSIGARILGGIRQLDEVVEGLLTHHERPDGRGYPQGLGAGELPIDGLIVGLADSFDAMTSDRTYRNALPLQAVVDEIRKYAGAQFDEKVVEALLRMDIEKLLDESRREADTVFPVNASEGRRA